MTASARRMLAALGASAAVGACGAVLLFAEMHDPTSALLFGGVLAWGLFTAASTPRQARHRATQHMV